jgi:hypothetical protein
MNLLMINNLFLAGFLIYIFFRGNANLDQRVAKGSMTVEQAAYYKKFLRPVCLIGAVCSLAAFVLNYVHL